MRARMFVAGLLLWGPGSAFAHGELVRAAPTPNTVVQGPLEEVRLEFSEPVELRFSIFKVYWLEDGLESTATEHGAGHEADYEGGHGDDHRDDQGSDHAATAGASPDDPEWLRLNGLAGALVSEVLTLRGDPPARMDAGPLERGSNATLTLALPEALPPGVYVVMWRVLAVDTHTTQGYYVFRLEGD